MCLEQFNYGTPRTFIYEFINRYNDPNSIYENFGLLRNDGERIGCFYSAQEFDQLVKRPRIELHSGGFGLYLERQHDQYPPNPVAKE